jgi:hypothetical protein
MVAVDALVRVGENAADLTFRERVAWRASSEAAASFEIQGAVFVIVRRGF